jgi:hypothetical protein
MTYNVFYSVEFLQQQFPRATIRRPVNGEMQHCCIIRRRRDSLADLVSAVRRPNVPLYEWCSLTPCETKRKTAWETGTLEI